MSVIVSICEWFYSFFKTIKNDHVELHQPLTASAPSESDRNEEKAKFLSRFETLANELANEPINEPLNRAINRPLNKLTRRPTKKNYSRVIREYEPMDKSYWR